MDGVQVMTCVLLAVTSDLISAQQLSAGCPPCFPGYYVKQNCSREADGRFIGVQCSRCTDCSAVGQVTEEACSMFTDSRCGDVTTPVTMATSSPAATTVSAPKDLIICTVIIVSVVVILLLLLLMLRCRNHHSHQHEKPLPPRNKPLPPHDKLLPCWSQSSFSPAHSDPQNNF